MCGRFTLRTPAHLIAKYFGLGDDTQLQTALRGDSEPPVADDASVIQSRPSAPAGGSGILVVGVENLLTALGKCCKPAPPDPIVGFVTRGKGVSIHRASCKNFAEMRSKAPERVIVTEWGIEMRNAVAHQVFNGIKK